MKKSGIICILTVLAILFTGCAGKEIDTDTETDGEIIPVEDDDELNEVDEMTGYLRYQTANGTQLAPVLDVQGQIVKSTVNFKSLRQTMELIANRGYTRVYVVVPGDGYPCFGGMRYSAPVKTLYSRLEENTLACGGNPIAMYAKAARSLKLEAIAIYKPYEGGGLTIPEGQTADNGNWYEDVPGGRRTYFDTFITEHPEMRVARRDNAHVVSDEPITKIEMAFMLDRVEDKDRYGSTVSYPAKRSNSIGTPEVTLYVSSDNYTYQKYEGNFNASWKTDKRDVYDSNGLLLYSNANVYVLTVDGFDLEDGTDYIAISFPNSVRSTLLTLPYSMTSVYCGDEKVTASVATWARRLWEESEYLKNDTPYNHTWGFEDEPVFCGTSAYTSEQFVNYFTQWGFEFEYGGSGYSGSGWMYGVGYCITKGKPQYLAGTLCEGYEEVREHWLDYVKYLSDDCGYDGVEIRLQNHSSFTTDCINYGYNKPIADRYMELYGVDITDLGVEITEDMYVKIMKIRGEFFEMFLEEASDYLHKNNKKFFMHLIADYANSSEWGLGTYSINKAANPYRPKVILDWKKCVDISDEISMKDFFYKVYDANVGLEIKKYAYEQGKTCWMHIYVFQNDATQRFLNGIIDDQYATGMLWYEFNKQRQTDIFDPLIDTVGFSRETVYVKEN